MTTHQPAGVQHAGLSHGKHRTGVTLIEVLTAMFIMAIGMLALLVLFPLGAISMGQALKDDRSASAAAAAANMAIAMDIRHDTAIIGGTGSAPGAADPGNLFVTGLPATYFGPSIPVFVDPYGQQAALGPLGGVIPRATLSFLTAGGSQVDRWFSFLDEINFTPAGSPDPTGAGAAVARYGNYSWAYLLQRRNAWEDNNVDLSVVIYRGRPTSAPQGTELTVTCTGAAGGTSLSGFSSFVPFKRGGWLLDLSATASPPVPNGFFYQVINVSDVGGTNIIDVQPALKAAVSNIVYMADVYTVCEKGVSWQP